MATGAAEIARLVATLPADWYGEGWSRVTAELGLVKSEQVGRRVTYKCQGMPDLDAYFDEYGVRELQVHLEIRWHEDEYSFPDTDAIFSELESTFQHACRSISSELGDASFVGGDGQPGYPSDELGDPLALWALPHLSLVLEVLMGEGDEGPWILALVAKRPRTLVTRGDA